MRRSCCCVMVVLVGAATFIAAPAASQSLRDTREAAYRVRIVRDATPVDATAVLVRREMRERDVVLHFVTAAHVFRTSGFSSSRALPSITVQFEGRALDVHPQDVTLPAGSLVDLAIFRVSMPFPGAVPTTLTLEVPPAGQPFVLAGFDASGAPAHADQRVRRRATLAVAGDRTPAGLTGCAGAAAIADRGVFGIATSCDERTAPLVVPFAAVADWLERHIPGGLALPSAVLTTLRLESREFPGPLLTVSCGEEQTGEVHVPIRLATGEAAVEATASLLKRTSLGLGEVSILSVADRSVTLRFTLAGQPNSAFTPPQPCEPGQALVSVRLDVISQRKR